MKLHNDMQLECAQARSARSTSPARELNVPEYDSWDGLCLQYLADEHLEQVISPKVGSIQGLSW